MISKLKSKGQTMVEYVVLLAVVVAVIISIMKFVRTKFLGDQANCTANSTAVVCIWQRVFNQSNNFRYFQIRK